MKNSQDFIKIFQSLTHSSHSTQVFSDWLEIISLTLHQAPYHLNLLKKDALYEKTENIYLKMVKKYSLDDLNIMGLLLGKITKIFQYKPYGNDWLGEIYTLLGGTESNFGQFFTPIFGFKAPPF